MTAYLLCVYLLVLNQLHRRQRVKKRKEGDSVGKMEEAEEGQVERSGRET